MKSLFIATLLLVSCTAFAQKPTTPKASANVHKTAPTTHTPKKLGASYTVNLTWSYSQGTNSDPAVGFRVYRSLQGSTTWTALNSTLIPVTTFTYSDPTVNSGTTYVYHVVSVDAANVESAPGNNWTGVIPASTVPATPTNLNGTVQ